jgi:hypothetical protein
MEKKLMSEKVKKVVDTENLGAEEHRLLEKLYARAKRLSKTMPPVTFWWWMY